MKYLISILICFFLINCIAGQYCSSCIPNDLIVTGDDVNFRSEPNTKSFIKGKLINSELLLLKEVVPGNEGHNWIMMNDSWLKVERIKTGEIGYVFGKFVRMQEAVSPDYKRIQSGKWYGLYGKSKNVVLKCLTPVLKVNDQGDTTLLGENQMPIISICSEFQLVEGNINGRIFTEYEGLITMGRKLELGQIKNRNYFLACTGEAELGTWMEFTRTNERIFFITEEIDGSQRHYSKQDLTDCIHKFGEVGYKLIFAGDLNNDGIPEIIFSEATNAESVIYYFMSNKEGKLELKSISYGVDNC